MMRTEETFRKWWLIVIAATREVRCESWRRKKVSSWFNWFCGFRKINFSAQDSHWSTSFLSENAGVVHTRHTNMAMHVNRNLRTNNPAGLSLERIRLAITRAVYRGICLVPSSSLDVDRPRDDRDTRLVDYGRSYIYSTRAKAFKSEFARDHQQQNRISPALRHIQRFR